MPANRSMTDPTQSDGSIEKGGVNCQFKYRSHLPVSSETDPGKLRIGLLSLSDKLKAVEEISQKLFQGSGDETETQPDSNHRAEAVSACETSASDASSPSRLGYQLSALMEVLKPAFNFNHWGVFLLRDCTSGLAVPDGGLQEVASSYHLEMNQSSYDLENEVRSQHAWGYIHQAISKKKRMHFAGERWNLLIVPLLLSNGREGFWAMYLDKGASVPSDSVTELLLWGAEMISTCLENAYGCRTWLSPKEESESWLAQEKLFTLSQLSRAMVHEVNNSMQIILGRAQIARMNLNKSKEATSQSNMWETIENNANRINRILKNFSDFLHRHSVITRVLTGGSSQKKISAPTKELNLHRILESNLDLLRYILGSSGIELELRSDCDDLLLVSGEPEELELTLLSLLWGIRDHLGGGGDIRVQTFPEEGELRLNIEWEGEKSDPEKSPVGNESGDYHRIEQAVKILGKFDRNLWFENVAGKTGKIALRIPAVEKTNTPVS